MLISLPLDPAKKEFAGISVQRFRVPYRKPGGGSWKNAADHIAGLRREMKKINDAVRGASAGNAAKDAYRFSVPEGLPERYASHPGVSVLKDGSRNVIIAIDRKKDFLVLTYEASLTAYARHWPEFLTFLDGFWVDKR